MQDTAFQACSGQAVWLVPNLRTGTSKGNDGLHIIREIWEILFLILRPLVRFD